MRITKSDAQQQYVLLLLFLLQTVVLAMLNSYFIINLQGPVY